MGSLSTKYLEKLENYRQKIRDLKILLKDAENEMNHFISSEWKKKNLNKK